MVSDHLGRHRADMVSNAVRPTADLVTDLVTPGQAAADLLGEDEPVGAGALDQPPIHQAVGESGGVGTGEAGHRFDLPQLDVGTSTREGEGARFLVHEADAETLLPRALRIGDQGLLRQNEFEALAAPVASRSGAVHTPNCCQFRNTSRRPHPACSLRPMRRNASTIRGLRTSRSPGSSR